MALVAGSKAAVAATSAKPYIGGVMPSRPTEMAAASSVPSSFLLAAEMKILAPAV
jgi:hypothetical protein